MILSISIFSAKSVVEARMELDSSLHKMLSTDLTANNDEQTLARDVSFNSTSEDPLLFLTFIGCFFLADYQN